MISWKLAICIFYCNGNIAAKILFNTSICIFAFKVYLKAHLEHGPTVSGVGVSGEAAGCRGPHGCS